MAFPDSLVPILTDPATIHFVPNTDRADFGEIDLANNPQKTSVGFAWFLPNRVTEAPVTFVGKVVYDVIGDKSGPYFSLPVEQYLPDVTVSKMGKAKVGFAIRFVNKELDEDAVLPEEFFEHNQAALEFFMSIQEAADGRMKSAAEDQESAANPKVSVKPFIKHEEGLPFYIVPIISNIVFPQFRGARAPGVLRGGGQVGRLSLNPNAVPSESEDNEGNTRIFFGDTLDPRGRYRVLKAFLPHRRYEMDVPPVFKANGTRIHPFQYKSAIPAGTIVAVRGTMKMYNIVSGDNINRPYVFVFDRMQIVEDPMLSWGVNPKKRPPAFGASACQAKRPAPYASFSGRRPLEDEQL